MRVLLFTGKGGVGKTTVAAATAVSAARAGKRVMVMSTDPAHSLADSFDVEIGSNRTQLEENLWAQQIDAQQRLESNWRDIQEYFIALMNWAGVDTIQAEELSVIPGLDEIFSLIDVKRHVESGAYDLLVVDCAPTAETLRLLSLPEKMVIAEARRTYTYLSLFGYRCDAVVVNRIIPDTVTDPYFGKWKEIQAEHLATVHESFDPLPILTARLFDQEMVGAELLSRMAAEGYGELDVTEILHVEERIGGRKRGQAYVLSLRLPFASRDDLDMHRRGDELFVKVGAYKRNLILPQTLQRLTIRDAAFVEDRLEIRFVREPRPAAQAALR